MIVTWTTFDLTAKSTVWYGIESINMSAHGSARKFVDGGPEKRQMFIHRVTLTALVPGQTYKYHVGSDDGWSPIFTFTALKKGNDWSPRFAIYGDLGNILAATLPRLQNEVQQGLYDAILHVGDIAYDLDLDNARVGDEFMRQIEPIAAYVPYQVCPGNHEQAYNFSNYDNRFSMISSGGHTINNHFWSTNIGPAHIISISTEFYYYTKQYGTHQIENQYRWLEQDLIEANKPENRAQRPWIITIGHRPLYAQNHIDNILREGFTFAKDSKPEFGFEELMYKHGVDLSFWAHEHNYERLWPIYNNKIYNGSVDEPYNNPKAPVHIITGSAGSRERHTTFIDTPHYSAFQNEEFGYTRMTIHNASHIYLEQLSVEREGGQIIDKFYLIKEKHGYDAWF
ncbi:unnamed protein product [Medioppia subpectinata]|uniref:Purple acid phosphatase n=1 Tax=Medioppia subpectinata TaxID=1979941 RepID=A0A7R9KQT4_9ACAR|nr:unnamed protein product [Medioppia subpectinata]CAG2108113.1 unnamed protein product [Medioppia subpectinata]